MANKLSVTLLAPTQEQAIAALRGRAAALRTELRVLNRRLDRPPGKGYPNLDHYWVVEWMIGGRWYRWSTHDTLREARATMQTDRWLLEKGSRVRKFVVA